jgi:hypothetical protein
MRPWLSSVLLGRRARRDVRGIGGQRRTGAYRLFLGRVARRGRRPSPDVPAR